MTRRIVALTPLFALTALPLACGVEQEAGSQSAYVEQNTAPTQVYTEEDGWLDIETDYLPRVCTQENGNASQAALQAQVIAARTYLLRHMRDNSKIGTEAKPVVNGESFQAYSAKANPGCIQAAQTTTGIVMKHRDAPDEEPSLIVANYVAGALVKFDGSKGKDPTKTEHFVTYNEGKSGTEIDPAPHPIASPSHPDNRGCMGQNRADYLSDNGADYETILKYFYGIDIELVALAGSPDPTTPNDGEACGELLASGSCYDDTLFWCAYGEVESFDCSKVGRVCVEQEVGPSCQDPDEPAPTCGDVTYEGTCENDVLTWCTEYGILETRNCADEGLACGNNPNGGGYDCLPAVMDDCSNGGGGAQCVSNYLVRCSGDSIAYLNCSSIGMTCGTVDGFIDCHPGTP